MSFTGKILPLKYCQIKNGTKPCQMINGEMKDDEEQEIGGYFSPAFF